MKVALLSFLVGISTIFSVQAVQVFNETCGKISLQNFDTRQTEDEFCQLSDIVIESFSSVDTKDHGMNVKAMTVTISGKSFRFDYLTDDMTLKFDETEEGKIQLIMPT